MSSKSDNIQHIFIIGSKSIGQYGGYETFVDKLTEQHQNEKSIRYHIACKANGDGFMDETKLDGVEALKKNKDGEVVSFKYHNAHVFKIKVPNIGPAVAIYYDLASLKYCIEYCKRKHIKHPIFYVLACRIGPFMKGYAKQIHKLGGKYYVNPDGHEWMRAKWSLPIRKYWKLSEAGMIKHSDLAICDSVNIEKYIKTEYKKYQPETTYISYGADIIPSNMKSDSPEFQGWLNKFGLKENNYYLVVGRFVPENNYETMIREFMKSESKKDFALITNVNDKFLNELDEKLKFRNDKRIKFVGTVYDSQLLKKIRENAFAYLHGHEVGGTNPSLLEALGCTNVNLLLDVNFNKEVAGDAAFYWSKKSDSLKSLLESVENLNEEEIAQKGSDAKERIRTMYSWEFIGNKYLDLWLSK